MLILELLRAYISESGMQSAGIVDGVDEAGKICDDIDLFAVFLAVTASSRTVAQQQLEGQVLGAP